MLARFMFTPSPLSLHNLRWIDLPSGFPHTSFVICFLGRLGFVSGTRKEKKERKKTTMPTFDDDVCLGLFLFWGNPEFELGVTGAGVWFFAQEHHATKKVVRRGALIA